ncbi:hypothetical protein ILUMI_17905, partial [Ignelater luminosus]
VPEQILDHVIRCQSIDAEYHGNKKEQRHLNVLVPLGVPQTGMDTVQHLYSFMCQNTCPSGINHRPFEVVFTLEDEMGTVYGRRKLNVGVSFSPKRSKESKERDFLEKLDSNDAASPSDGKKTEKVDIKSSTGMLPALDTRLYTLT